MGSITRFFLLLTLLGIGAMVGGEAIMSRIPLDQVLFKARTGIPASGKLTPGSEESVVPLERMAGVWVVRVEFNDLHLARMIVDTGATFTTISEDLAFDIGVQTDPVYPQVNLFTAGGNVQAEMGLAQRIRVGNAGRDHVQVVIHTIPNLPEGIDGLLGLSFFDQFSVQLDHTNHQLFLTPKS